MSTAHALGISSTLTEDLFHNNALRSSGKATRSFISQQEKIHGINEQQEHATKHHQQAACSWPDCQLTGSQSQPS
eukprot:scaffold157805_cov17-Prasinocladus_malaysianus.AAC.1